MSKATDPKYGDFLKNPSRYTVREAWIFHPHRLRWEEIDLKTHEKFYFETGKVDFDHLFPGTPPLPPQAFPPLKEPHYGDWNYGPTRWNEREAWVLMDRTTWEKIDLGSHSCGLYETSKEEYERRNPPPLPPEAFKESRE